ncbi:peptidoglycan-binding domain-containing protein [Brasilonema sp. UFV-L1]|uniref:peptidoglycan-binding domain-containing protein n=1 Tax=Brasilonema sp. UFV-L1 TaxID=2234130 RepID=UPI00145C68FA|nr:peptidoglycan-binding domain-containing protein [Brasilonema sp. UFV-L1]NMG10730.1 hypothetical protein [Brasilonema sp. UFV-L1]
MTQYLNGVWIWNLSEIRDDYLDKLVERKVQRVYFKVFDGKYQDQPTFWNWQCSPEIIQEFNSRNIQVYGWGYHYGTADIARQIVKVRQALNCGLDGYIVDVEKEVEDSSTHTNIDKLLSALRIIVKGGTFGYTSFGNPRLHPNIPWKILDKYCDFTLPQIYFEKFTFKPTNPEKVKDCLDAYKNLGLKKPILPIWGSESDTAKPATVAELQDYLNYYSGSSIWRIPQEGERGEAWNLIYSGFELPILRRNLRQGRIGDDVKAVQKAMNARGYNAGTVDGNFGSQTEVAVRAFQKEAGLSVDGEVGKLTWTALGGQFHG